MIGLQADDGIGPELERLHGPELQKTMRNAFRRVANRITADARKRARSRGVGRAIWGKKAKGIPITLGRPRVTDGSIEADVTAKGLLGLQETGGRTRAHAIKPKLASALAFETGGRTIFARSVRHPGGQLPRIPSVEQALEAGSGQIMDEIERSIDALIAKAGP